MEGRLKERVRYWMQARLEDFEQSQVESSEELADGAARKFATEIRLSDLEDVRKMARDFYEERVGPFETQCPRCGGKICHDVMGYPYGEVAEVWDAGRSAQYT